MAFRPLATAGIAFAAAGVMAFTPTIVPQLTEREEQVAKATSANVKLAADLKDLINVYFGTNPYNGIPFDTDIPGTFGATGVLYQLLKEQAGGFEPNQEFLDDFFLSGAAEVVRTYLLSGTADPNTINTINVFFDEGATGIAYRYFRSGTADPNSIAYLDAFFNRQQAANPALYGTSGVIFLRLMASDLTLEQKAVVNDFFRGGATQVAYTQIASRNTNPQAQPYIDTFFNINNPNGDIDPELISPTNPTGNTGASSNPALFGVSGAVFRRLQEAAVTGNLTPQQFQVTDDFFRGGATQVALRQILDRTSDPNQRAIINEFFANGVAGVVRYLLVGPAPIEPEETLLRVAAQTSVSPVEEAAPESELKVEALTAPAPEARSARQAPAVTLEAPTADKPAAVTPVAVVESAPAVQPAPVVDPAPVAAPAPEPVAKPTSKIREKSAEEEAEAEKLKSGNKAEVEPIILTGDGPKSGEGSWGVFGDIANSIGQALNGGGAAPAGGATGDTGGDGAGAAG